MYRYIAILHDFILKMVTAYIISTQVERTMQVMNSYRLKKKDYHYTVLFWLILVISSGCASIDYKQIAESGEVPPLIGRVNDFSQTLSAEQINNLNSIIIDFEKELGPQFVVLIINTTGDTSLEDYSIQVMNAWGIGRKEYNDGIGIIVAIQDRKVRIELGSGTSSFFSDKEAERILNQNILPQFKQGNIYQGILNGTKEAIKVFEDGMPREWRPKN